MSAPSAKTVRRKLYFPPGFKTEIARRKPTDHDNREVGPWLRKVLLEAARASGSTITLCGRLTESEGSFPVRFSPGENKEITSRLDALGDAEFSDWARVVVMSLPVIDTTAKPAEHLQRCIAPADFKHFDRAYMINVQVGILEHLSRLGAPASDLVTVYCVMRELELDFRKLSGLNEPFVTGNGVFEPDYSI